MTSKLSQQLAYRSFSRFKVGYEFSRDTLQQRMEFLAKKPNALKHIRNLQFWRETYTLTPTIRSLISAPALAKLRIAVDPTVSGGMINQIALAGAPLRFV